MPRSWTDSLPVHDQKWVSRTMFVVNGRGKPVLRDILQLWWYPPQSALVYMQPPASVDPFYARPFFLWMPYRMWRVVLTCTQPKCHNKQLTACGLYKTVRWVLDITGYFHMGTEYMECGACHKKYAAWSFEMLQQLDIAHVSQFPALLTYRYLTISHRA